MLVMCIPIYSFISLIYTTESINVFALLCCRLERQYSSDSHSTSRSDSHSNDSRTTGDSLYNASKEMYRFNESHHRSQNNYNQPRQQAYQVLVLDLQVCMKTYHDLLLIIFVLSHFLTSESVI